jgi:hypothetical protein
MKRVAAFVVGIAIAAASPEFAVPAASAGENTATTPTADWSEGGRWLTPYEMPGWNGGYRVTWGTAKQAKSEAKKDGGAGTPRPETHPLPDAQ